MKVNRLLWISKFEILNLRIFFKLLFFIRVKNFYRSVAIQIKILISIPEYIWMCLDNGDFLKAVHLYLLAIHIYTGLELDTEHKIAEIFTILSRLKLSINSFRNRILDGIRKRLQAVHLGPEVFIYFRRKTRNK